MKAGFAKSDITPRVGVELCGFGPFECRHSIGVRDRLWARAMALEADGQRLLVIACDLVGISLDLGNRARAMIAAATGLPAECVLICCSHTHSGPNTGPYIGWGAPDAPYRETVHTRIARAGSAAVQCLQEATLHHAEVPCHGIGKNREYDSSAAPLDQVLRDDWRPAKPELTDTTCHVLAARAADGRLLGFASYFGCHPVVCCAQTRYIHGDFPGVATNQVERDHDGVVGLFLQGAQGDVNSCVVHKPEPESLLALDVVAGRYARAVRHGIAEARPLAVDRLAAVRETVVFSRKQWSTETIAAMLAEKEAKLDLPDITDAYAADDWNLRMETVYILALRDLLRRAREGQSLAPATELHGMRIGPLALLGSPFETFQAIKNDVVARAAAEIPLVLGFVNDSIGYAPDREKARRGGYAVDMVPLICGQLPFANAHDELVDGLLRLDARLNGETSAAPR